MPIGRKRKSYATAPYIKRRKTPYRRKSFMSRNVSRIARQVVMRAAETKTKVINYGKTELYHNSLSVTHKLNFTAHMPAQGDGKDGRSGDSIIGKGWKLRMTLANKGDRPNVTYRLVVFAAKAGVTPTYSNTFVNVTGNGLLDGINTDRCTILYQKWLKPNKGMVGTSETGVREYVSTKSIWIKREKVMKFNGLEVNDRDVYFCMLAYDAYGTLTADNIGYMQMWGEFKYKDP
ncbi:hypothetical protein [Ctenophore-associated circular virus 3]|uniref:hypothetical protein n=1 Tax=Ctenophore-associated circular virus 3 TaxID=1778560 RepID=UPI000764CF57|nr:hypothetical protein [Ctenophore-associated circular virus 3]ALY05861.1 hypothetical protein [Ctenophore-associated circular virus 3]